MADESNPVDEQLTEQLIVAINNGDDLEAFNLLRHGATLPLESDRQAFFNAYNVDSNFRFYWALGFTTVATGMTVAGALGVVYMQPFILYQLPQFLSYFEDMANFLAFMQTKILCLGLTAQGAVFTAGGGILIKESLSLEPIPRIVSLAVKKGNLDLAKLLANEFNYINVILLNQDEDEDEADAENVISIYNLVYILSKLKSLSKLDDINSKQDIALAILVDSILNRYQVNPHPEDPESEPANLLDDLRVLKERLQRSYANLPKITFWQRITGNYNPRTAENIKSYKFLLDKTEDSIKLIETHAEFRATEQATKRCILSKTALKSMQAHTELGGDIEKKILTFAFPEHNDESLKECFMAAKQGTNWQVAPK